MVIGELSLHEVEKITMQRRVFKGVDPFVGTVWTFWSGGKKVFIVRAYTSGENPPVVEMVQNET